MAEPANPIRTFQQSTSRPIVRPLSPESAAEARAARPDPADPLRASLFAVDQDWFDRYWYGARRRAPGRLLARLHRMIDAMASRRRVSRGRFKQSLRGVLALLSPHAPDLRPSRQ